MIVTEITIENDLRINQNSLVIRRDLLNQGFWIVSNEV